MDWKVELARVLLSLIFISAAFGKFRLWEFHQEVSTKSKPGLLSNLRFRTKIMLGFVTVLGLSAITLPRPGEVLRNAKSCSA
jgi:hypothetical protein